MFIYFFSEHQWFNFSGAARLAVHHDICHIDIQTLWNVEWPGKCDLDKNLWTTSINEGWMHIFKHLCHARTFYIKHSSQTFQCWIESVDAKDKVCIQLGSQTKSANFDKSVHMWYKAIISFDFNYSVLKNA